MLAGLQSTALQSHIRLWIHPGPSPLTAPLSISQPAGGFFSHSYLPGSPVSPLPRIKPLAFPLGRAVPSNMSDQASSSPRRAVLGHVPAPAFYILVTSMFLGH